MPARTLFPIQAFHILLTHAPAYELKCGGLAARPDDTDGPAAPGPGLLAEVSAAGLDGDPPSGALVTAQISLENLPTPVAYTGQWDDGPHGRTPEGLPMCLLAADPPQSLGLPPTLLLLMDSKADRLLLYNSREGGDTPPAVASPGGWGLRVRLLALSPIAIDPSHEVLMEVKLGAGAGRDALLLSEGSSRELCLPLPGGAVTVTDLHVALLLDGVDLLARGCESLGHLEPHEECPLTIPMQPQGEVLLLVELCRRKSLAAPATGPHGETAEGPVVEDGRVRHAGYLLKLQRKKFGLYHRRWFELQGTALHYSERRGAAAPLRRLDITQATIIPLQGPAPGVAVCRIVAEGYGLTVKAPAPELRQWVGLLLLAQRQAIRPFMRPNGQSPVRSILKSSLSTVRSESMSEEEKSVTIVSPRSLQAHTLRTLRST